MVCGHGAWLPDNGGFYYTRYPAAGAVPGGEEHYHRAIYFHRLGENWEDDRLVYQPREKEFWPGVSLSPDGRWAVVGWPEADQFVFLRVTGGQQLRAVANVSAQFRSRTFPRISGWAPAAR